MSENTYRESDLLTRLRQQLAGHQGAKPGVYDSKWQEALDDVVSQILSLEDFSYDPGLDPLFQQYQDRYVNLGQRAMEDTLGRAAALTGGYGNSHAQLAGQQAYQTQLQGLYDRVPELYSLAMERYRLQGDSLTDRYSLLKGLDSTDYSRHQDALSQWNREQDFLTDRFDAERDFDYTAHRDNVSDSQWQQEFDEELRQFNFKNKLGEFARPSVSQSGYTGSRKQPQEPENPKRSKRQHKTYAEFRHSQ